MFFQVIYFLQNGALHFRQDVRQFLNNTFKGRWVGRSGQPAPHTWTPSTLFLGGTWSLLLTKPKWILQPQMSYVYIDTFFFLDYCIIYCSNILFKFVNALYINEYTGNLTCSIPTWNIFEDQCKSLNHLQVDDGQPTSSPEAHQDEDIARERECSSRSSAGRESPEQMRSATDADPSSPSSPHSPAPSVSSEPPRPIQPPPFSHMFPFGDR